MVSCVLIWPCVCASLWQTLQLTELWTCRWLCLRSWVGVLRWLHDITKAENDRLAVKGAYYVCVCVAGEWVGKWVGLQCLEGSLNLIVCRRLPSCFILSHFLSADSAGESWSGKHVCYRLCTRTPSISHAHTHIKCTVARQCMYIHIYWTTPCVPERNTSTFSTCYMVRVGYWAVEIEPM